MSQVVQVMTIIQKVGLDRSHREQEDQVDNIREREAVQMTGLAKAEVVQTRSITIIRDHHINLVEDQVETE